jgi:hypothetical protein
VQLILSGSLEEVASHNDGDLMQETDLGGFSSSTLTLQSRMKEEKWLHKALDRLAV